MSATPAQVANDMAARAPFWRGRDGEIQVACSQAAKVIRSLLAGERVDGRTVRGLLVRISCIEDGHRQDATRIGPALNRARHTIMALCREAGE